MRTNVSRSLPRTPQVLNKKKITPKRCFDLTLNDSHGCDQEDEQVVIRHPKRQKKAL